jgi:hypothetical protein
MSPEIKDMIRKSGGLLYVRQYKDRNACSDETQTVPPMLQSWQEKCNTENREVAIKYFTDIGFKEEDISFDESGTMTVRFHHAGFVHNHGNESWFNIVESGLPKRADGSDFPSPIIAQIQLELWGAVFCFKLRRGDWLVLDNLAVQHGRLPYKENPQGSPRTLLTVYTE